MYSLVVLLSQFWTSLLLLLGLHTGFSVSRHCQLSPGCHPPQPWLRTPGLNEKSRSMGTAGTHGDPVWKATPETPIMATGRQTQSCQASAFSKDDGETQIFMWNLPKFKINNLETSLVVHRLRIHLAMRRIWVRSPVGELRSNMTRGN